MRCLLKTSSWSALLVLIAAFTFSACSNHKNNTRNQQTDRQAYNNRSSSNMNRSDNKMNEEMLLGKVINARTGRAVANATVMVNLTGNKNFGSVTTNRNGLFIVTGITKGDHVIKVRGTGYQIWKNTVYVPSLNKNNAAGPFNGFFMPSESSNGWFHGVFQTSDNNNNPSNIYAKSVFVVIGLRSQ